MAGTVVGRAIFELIPSVKGIQQSIASQVGAAGAAGDRLGASVGSRIGANIKRVVAPIAAAVGVGAIVGFAKKSVDSFADVEDATAAAGVIFGKNMDQIIGQAEKADTTLGMSKAQVIDAANTFGTFGKAAGLSGKDLSGFSTEMTTLAGDLSSFKGGSPEEAIQAIGSALRGESEPIRRYGVLLDDATLRNRALKMGLISTTKDALTPQQKSLAAHQEILAQTKDAQGDFIREQDSTANVAKITAAQFENLSAKIGGVLAPAFTKARLVAQSAMTAISTGIDRVGAAFQVLQSGGSGMDIAKALGLGGGFATTVAVAIDSIKNLSTWISQNGTTIARVAGVIGTLMIPMFIRLGVQATIAGAKMVAGWVMSAAGAARTAVMYVVNSAIIVASWVRMGVQAVISGAQTVAIWAMYQIEAVKAAAAHAASVARIVAGWVAMGAAAAVSGIRQAAAWVAGIVVGAATAVASMAVTVARVVAGWVLMGVQSMIQAARMAAAWFIALGPIGWVTAAVIAIVALIIANWSRVKAFTIAVWSAVSNFVRVAWAAIVAWVTGAVNNVRARITAVMAAVRAIWNAGWSAVRQIVTNVLNAVRSFVSSVINAIRAYINAGVNAWRAIISSVMNAIRSIVSSVWNGISAVVRGVIGAIRGAVSGGFNTIRSIISGTMNGARSIVSSVWNGIVGTVRNTVGNVISAVSGIKGRIMGALSGAGSWLVSVGQDMIQGLIGGVRGMIDSAVQAVKDVGGSMLSGVKSFLGIKSPSRRFRYEVGQQVGEGAILGIKDKYGDAAKAAAGLVKVPTVAGSSYRAASSPLAPAGDTIVYVTNPFTGEQVRAVVRSTAQQEISNADSDAGRRRIGVG